MMPKRFGDISIEFDPGCDDAVSASLTMLARSIAQLPPSERADALFNIESEIRAQVARFVAARALMSSPPYPQAKSNGAAT
jgi:acyl-CoA reductase-like NAD-dependent aldehyde dehydrogenase